MKLFGIVPAVFALLLGTLFLLFPQPVKAADVRTGENVILSANQKTLKDLYLFGSTVQLNAPVTNDVVAAGGMIDLTGNITNDVLAAGGNVTIQGKVGNTLRVAGGNVTITGSVTHDLVVAGGNVTVSRNATVGGDLLIAGGQVNVEGPVRGKVLMSGGNVTLNSTVGGNVIGGEVGTLTLGPQAKINGNLTYSSPQPAQNEAGSSVLGKTTYHHVQRQTKSQQEISQAAIGSAVYKLIADIIISLLFIYFFRSGILTILNKIQKSPWKSLGVGFVYMLLAPIASAILLILVWLGLASFLTYGLTLIISIFFANVFVGWWLMSWWERRQKQSYLLDWKAGVVGPIVLFIILLIPILGWLVASLIFLAAVGAFVGELFSFVPQLQGATKKK
jgi:hypothetical protein